MAYAALVSVSHTLEQILDSDPYFFPCSKEKVEAFQETIVSLLAFLDNCPPICTQTIKDLTTQIRDSAYEAEDIFESLVATHFLKKYGSDSYEKFKVFSLEKVMEDIESIEKEVKKIHKDVVGVHKQRILAPASSSKPTLRGSNIKMVALDPDLEMKVMEELVGGESKFDVITVVGMGGIGKTTLARILYDSKLIKESFEVCGWVTISQTYSAEEIVLGILKDIGVPLDAKKDGEQHLYQSLYNRKYLIVLDDVWNTQAWDDLKRLFPDNGNGSRIILTTRHSKVAAYANTFSTYHEMQLLNENSSWRLLCQEIFLQNNCPPELVVIGKEIARQCQGLPLAISAIGGHLKKEKQTEESWKYVSEKLKSVLQTTNDMSLEILTLSYNYLPHPLKACFLYVGYFPEDHPIDASRIVKLWVAEGFVKPSGLNSMDEVAEEYLQDFIDRSLVFVSKYDSLGKPKTCGIHDLFRDICIREAKKEKNLYVLNRDIPFDIMEVSRQRRLILSPNFRLHDGSPSSSIVSRDGNCQTARSLICLGNHQTCSLAIKLASRLLKVLSIRMQLSRFPVEILELVNLKYLQLGDVPEIPSSICRLRNLQTLIVFSMDVESMPSEVWEMQQLRHLLLADFHLPDIPDFQGGSTNAYILISLQTLSRIINFKCTQEVLTRIPNLKKLNIVYNMDFEPFHPLKNLVDLCKLESLRCEFRFGPNINILRNLAFPCSLRKLVLVGSQIPWERMTIIGILPNLEVLKLKDGATKGKLWETNDGEFEQLKFLLIRYSDLVEWKTEKEHFPSLRHLILEYCFELESIPPEIGEIPTLETIELILCSRDLESSANEILGEDSDVKLTSDANDCCIS